MVEELGKFSLSVLLKGMFSLASDALTFITTHEVTAILFACSLVPIGFGIVKLAKGSAKRG